MPPLVFDDGPDVDPAMPLLGLLDEWVETLQGRRAVNTVAGYVSDTALFLAELAVVVGRPVVVREELAVPAPTRAGPGASQSSLVKLRSAGAALTLVDLAPRNLGRCMDRLGRDRAPASLLRMAAAMSSFCELLVRRELLAGNPMLSPAVARPAAPEGNPAPLQEEEIARLLDTVVTQDPQARQPWPARDLALAGTLLCSGVRLSEAVGLCAGDVLTVDGGQVLRVLGKGGKFRSIPLNAELAPVLAEYLAERRGRLGEITADSPLFVRWDGETFSPQALRRLVERWYARAGVRRHPGAAVHALRHTFACVALASGASAVEVQTLLGHRSLETTRRYLMVLGEGLREAIAAHAVGPQLRRVRTARGASAPAD